MNKIVLSFFALFSMWAVAASSGVPTSQASVARDQEQSAGGWGMDCTSGNVTCNSGRVIGCQANLSGSVGGSECTQHTGDVGWVNCYTYDSTGASTSSFYDACP